VFVAVVAGVSFRSYEEKRQAEERQ